ncbi:MAG: hypothetical protein JXR49_05180 [Acidobacteria bacterium]|nr:hypothetical protein [Acidobacteriota bacterium]
MTLDYLSKDVREFLALLFQKDVRYLIVGGEAVIYHGYPRLTGDMDIFYDSSAGNAKKLWEALNIFWGGEVPGMKDPEGLSEKGAVFQFGVPPNRIDLLNDLDGISFQSAWRNRVEDELPIQSGRMSVFFIGIDDLIKNKRAVSRHKDRDDLRFLERKRKMDS